MPHSFATTSAFEILGPIMVGPSSSHTAGALRLAQVAASLVPGPFKRARFTLWNSFAHTYRGHGSDRALVAGILGLGTDDPQIARSLDTARLRGLEVEFVMGGDDVSLHPNTIDIDLVNGVGQRVSVRGESLGGGKVRLSRLNDVAVDISGEYDTLFVSHRDEPGALAALTSALARARVNIAFCRTYRTERGGMAYTVFEMDEPPSIEALGAIRALGMVEIAAVIEIPGHQAPAAGKNAPEMFDDGAELLEVCAERGASIGAVMEEREQRMRGEASAAAHMARVLSVMREETEDPVARPRTSLGGLIGGEARGIADASRRYAPPLMGAVQTDAVARAMAVLERSAAMGVIVAAPTAGSAGVVPGCVLAVGGAVGADDEAIKGALWCAAAIGLNLSTEATVAGAEGGCQAEVGSASAMAAGALVELLGGTPAQALDAASLALGNLLGLVCDPVGGLVEVPCQTRNAIGVANAVSAAQLALSGVRALVPFDQMARAMLEVGRSLPVSLRETARGGIAATPAACAICAACGLAV